MASTVTWSTIYLGSFADMDTDEASNAQEDTSALLTTFGAGPGDALSNNIVDVQTHTDYSNSEIFTDNSGSSDTIQYDLGSGAVTAAIDSIAVMHGTVTFHDGSTYEADFHTFQDDLGNVFMTVLDSQPELASGGLDTVTFTSVVTSSYYYLPQTNRDDYDFVCFGPGTRLATPLGPKRADKLQIGDFLTTLDDGPQPIRWIGKRRLSFDTPHPAQPVRIAAGAFGPHLPTRALILSPSHRVLIDTVPSHALHDPLGALAPAKALTRQKGIRFAAGRRAITYFNFLLPSHAILLAEGIAVESLYPAPGSWAQLTGPERSDWIRLARDARVTGAPPARLLLSTAEARAGLDGGALTLPSTPPVAAGWTARTRRAPPRPLHLRSGAITLP